MYYYDEQKSLCKICDALRSLGWNIFGYHEDTSDPMTDYFNPESWDGIAEKNGYVFCANVNDWIVKRYSGQEVFTNTEEVYKGIDSSKIKQLQALANDQAATEGEKQAALDAIERIKNRAKKEQEVSDAKRKLLYKIPEFQVNPPRCNWHIEKNGKIVAKGNGAFQFYNLAYNGDCMRPIDEIMKENRYYAGDDRRKTIEKFQSFIKKIESISSMKIGDEEDPEFETIMVEKKKTIIKPVICDKDESGYGIKEGNFFILNTNFNYGRSKGNVYKIYKVTDKLLYAHRMNRKLTKELSGSSNAANHFCTDIERFDVFFKKGAISFCILKEDVIVEKSEKCVKKTQNQHENVIGSSSEKNKIKFDIVEDVDTRDNSSIFVVKLKDTLDKDLFKNVTGKIKEIGGYYSRFKKGFLFRENPTEKLSEVF